MKRIVGVVLMIMFASASAYAADPAAFSVLTADLALPGVPGGGTGTNFVSYTYSGKGAVVSPIQAFAPNTNGTITVTLDTPAITNFTVGVFSPGSRTLDMTGFPLIRYGEKYTFTDSATNSGRVLLTFLISNP